MNYGLPSLSQQVPVITDLLELARHIQRIIATFESRLDPRSIKVVPLINKGETWVLASCLTFMPGATYRAKSTWSIYASRSITPMEWFAFFK